MSGQPAVTGGELTTPTSPVPRPDDKSSVGGSKCAAWVAMVMLLDYTAAFLSFAAAAGYLVLKAYNDQQSVLMRVIEEAAQWFYNLGIHEMPGLPSDYLTLRNFADPFFARDYMISMAALHLLATAGFLGLVIALGRFRRWARRAHILIAAMAILILGAYASVYARSPAPRVGLTVMAVFAVVPVAVLAIFLSPPVASRFDQPRQPGAEASPHRKGRANRRPRLILALFLSLFVLGALMTVFVVSVPVAINLKLALTPAE
jgi:hypothetical protein